MHRRFAVTPSSIRIPVPVLRSVFVFFRRLLQCPSMSTPQDPPRRRKQKARRAKQLAAWRAKNPKKGEVRSEASPAAPAKRGSK